MHPAWLAGAVVLALYLVVRRRAHGPVVLVAGGLAAVAAGLIGAGVIELPNVEHLIEEAGQTLGRWTYLAVGVLAFLETGAFIGLVAPGETTVIVGGLVAGQGQISLLLLIAIVWSCAVLGDITSYTLGRRLGRDFMVRHGARVKITEERLEQVEDYFDRRGGMTILIGRFIGLVRAIAPFIAGASHMPLRKFLPYDVLGAGLWATTFCVLGYVFWRSFDQLTAWVSRGLFAFGLVVALIVGIVFLVRLQRSEELQRRTKRWIAAQLEKPMLRPLAPYLRAGWRARRAPGGRVLGGAPRDSSGTASRRASWDCRSRRCWPVPRSGRSRSSCWATRPRRRASTASTSSRSTSSTSSTPSRSRTCSSRSRSSARSPRPARRGGDGDLGGDPAPIPGCVCARGGLPDHLGRRRGCQGGLRSPAAAGRTRGDRGDVISVRARCLGRRVGRLRRRAGPRRGGSRHPLRRPSPPRSCSPS